MIRNDNPDKGTEGTAGVESQAGYVAEIRNDNPDKGTEDHYQCQDNTLLHVD